jgi:predicted porin
MRIVCTGVVAACLLSSSAFAQSTAGWNDLPDRFQFDTGYFRLDASTTLRYNGAQGNTGDVNFEQDLGLPERVNTFWLDGSWRVGRRHQLKLASTRLSREHQDYTLTRDFVWGGQTYSAGLSATSTNSASILGGYYRFAIVRNERFEIGPTLGVGYLWLSAGIRATGTVSGPGGSQSQTLDQQASTGSITGALGGYASGWLTKRLVLRGDYLYIKVKPENSEASVTDWRLAADYYFTPHIGVGVQYKYNRYSYDRGILVSELGGEIKLKGGQIFASFLF